MKMYDLPEKWSQTIGEGHLAATITIFIADENDYGDTFGARLKFVDKDLNPPDEDCWTVDSWIGIYRNTTVKQVIDQAVKSATKFYNFMVALMTNYGNDETISNWAKHCADLQDHLNDVLQQNSELKKEIKEKTVRINQLETDYVNKLESEIVRLKKKILKTVGTLLTLVKELDVK